MRRLRQPDAGLYFWVALIALWCYASRLNDLVITGFVALLNRLGPVLSAAARTLKPHL